MSDAVEARRVVFRFGPRVALGASSFRIPRGRVTAVIGPNGSGKSTLLNGIAGLLRPEEGSLTVLGGEPSAARRRIAYVLQTSKVNETMPVSVREVVAMGRYSSLGVLRPLGSRDRGRVEEAMERMGITDLARRHLSELSGGQRQRVFVAQGIAQDHEILLLDEPLTGLDVVSVETIARVVEQERESGRTVVMTTHDLAEAARADHVLLLSQRVVASGPPGEALTSAHLAAAYGAGILRLESGVVVDDPAHAPVASRHVHMERRPETRE